MSTNSKKRQMNASAKQKNKTNARALSYRVLLKFEQEHGRLDGLLNEQLKHVRLDNRQQRFLRNLTSGTVRHLIYLDWIIARLYRGRFRKMLLKQKTVLRLALYELIKMQAVPQRATLFEYGELSRKFIGSTGLKVVNGILRSFLRRKDELQPQKLISDPVERISVRYSFPLWMVKRWISFWGEEETEALCRQLNEPPQFELRVNTPKISVELFGKLLKEKKIDFQPSSHFPDVLAVSDIQAVRQAGWFEQGYCLVQDESAHIPVEALQPAVGETVLDVCAAPGGKYTQILQKQQGRGLAVGVDIDLQRLKRVKENVRHLGLSGGAFVCADARNLPFKKSFDKILLDAPCSGLGVIRKHPDIKWRRDFREIVEFSALQSAILEKANDVLKPGGYLVYSTCTLDYMENENVVQNFVERFAEQIKLTDIPAALPGQRQKQFLRTFPHRHNTDGSFCALLEKM